MIYVSSSAGVRHESPQLRRGVGIADREPDRHIAKVGNKIEPTTERLHISGDDLKRSTGG